MNPLLQMIEALFILVALVVVAPLLIVIRIVDFIYSDGDNDRRNWLN